MKRKSALVFFLLTVVALICVSGALGQSSSSGLVGLSTNTLTLAGKASNQQLSTSINLIGVSNETVNIKFFAGELRDNTTGNIISAEQVRFSQNGFSLTTNGQIAINVNVTISNAKEGSYQGTIIILSSRSNGQIAQSSINITVKITTDKSVFSFLSQPVNLYLIPILLGLLVVVLILGLTGDSKRQVLKRAKPIVIILLGFSAVYVWIYILSNYTLGELNSVISTLIVVPLVTFVIAYVNEKRTNSNKKADTSREIQSKAIEKDIDSIRNILGELATHYASFKPNLYEEATGLQFQPSAKAMYNKDGIITRKVWNDFCKQGMMADMPVLELEKYYDFVNTYNLCYSYALMKSTQMTQNDFQLVMKKSLSFEEKKKLSPVETKAIIIEEARQSQLEKPFFDAFEDFRAKYGDCENVLFVNLTFYLGLFMKSYLYEEKVEYPRVTRTLLKRLVDYGILTKKDFTPTYRRSKKWLKGYEKKLQIKFSTERLENEFDKIMKEQLQDKFDKFKQNPQKYDKEFIRYKKFRLGKEIAKELIDKWKMSADELETIVEKIYHQDNIPKFYRRVEDDFQTKYNALKTSLDAVVLPSGFDPDEKKLPMVDELKTYKLLNEDLTALKKLREEEEITPEKFEELKKKLLQKT